MSQRHQQAMYRKRTAWTIIRDSYELAAFQRVSAYMGAYADGLLFALKTLKERPLGKNRRLPRGQVSDKIREDTAKWLANPRRVEELAAYIEAAIREAVTGYESEADRLTIEKLDAQEKLRSAVAEERKALREIVTAHLMTQVRGIGEEDPMPVLQDILADLDARDAEPKEGA